MCTLLKLPSAHFTRCNHHCDSQYVRDLTVVDIKGRQHDVLITFCHCEAEPVTLVRFKLWPASPKSPRVAFQMTLMDLQRMLFLEGHLSIQSFCSTLEHLQSELPFGKKVGYILSASQLLYFIASIVSIVIALLGLLYRKPSIIK